MMNCDICSRFQRMVEAETANYPLPTTQEWGEGKGKSNKHGPPLPGPLLPRYLFSEGGAGDSPAPPGDPPGGLVVMPRCENPTILRSMPLQVPSGGSPDGTGGSPVLPTANTYLPRGRRREHPPPNLFVVSPQIHK